MTNDDIRDVLLQFLYHRHETARGVKAQGINLRDLQGEMKRTRGLRQQDVAANLDYLVQKGWVVREKESRPVTLAGGTTRSSDKVTYKVSAEGIDRVEGESRFPRTGLRGGIQITNQHGFTIVGDRNVVRSEYRTLSAELAVLQREIERAPLTQEQRTTAITDLQTLQLQLSKTEPDHGIVQRAWLSLRTLATVDGVAGALERVAPLVLPIIGAAGLAI